VTRRTGLVALGLALPAVAVAACSRSSVDPSTPTSPSTGPAAGSATGSGADTDPSVQAADEAALVARYDAVIAAFPGAAAVLTSIRDQHASHRDALGGADAEAATTSTVPTSLDRALADLADAERTAARARIAACVDARDPDLASLLTLVAASEASHVPELTGARPR